MCVPKPPTTSNKKGNYKYCNDLQLPNGNQKWDRAESNRRHTDFQSVALPTELQSRSRDVKYNGFSNLFKVSAEEIRGYGNKQFRPIPIDS